MPCKKTLPKAILLDRDGVINVDSPDYILTPEQWMPISGSLAAIALLKQHAIKIGLVSNQSALGRKMLNHETFQDIEHTMMQAITDAGGNLDHIAYCPHHPDDGCTCRKPLAGMIHDSLAALGLSDKPESVVMIGDSLRDVQAAMAGGVTPILVQSGYGDADAILKKAQTIYPTIQAYPNLSDAVAAILGDCSC